MGRGKGRAASADVSTVREILGGGGGEAGYGRPEDGGVWTAKTVKQPPQQPADSWRPPLALNPRLHLRLIADDALGPVELRIMPHADVPRYKAHARHLGRGLLVRRVCTGGARGSATLRRSDDPPDTFGLMV